MAIKKLNPSPKAIVEKKLAAVKELDKKVL
jgi:hypothetical protein